MTVIVKPGDTVTFEARDLRDAERAVELSGVVDRVAHSHVWLRLSRARMCVALSALRSVNGEPVQGGTA